MTDSVEKTEQVPDAPPVPRLVMASQCKDPARSSVVLVGAAPVQEHDERRGWLRAPVRRDDGRIRDACRHSILSLCL